MPTARFTTCQSSHSGILRFTASDASEHGISNFVLLCLNCESPIVYGDGTQTYDFTFIDDVVTANLVVLDADAADEQAVNVGGTATPRFSGLQRRSATSWCLLDIEFANCHDTDAEHTHADTANAAELLDYEPMYTIREGFKASIESYHANRDWYEPLLQSS